MLPHYLSSEQRWADRSVLLCCLLALLTLFAPATMPAAQAAIPASTADTEALPAWVVPPIGYADVSHTAYWTGRGADTRWSNAANWSDGRVPGQNTRVLLAGAQTIMFDGRTSLAGLLLDTRFTGTLVLAHPLLVAGELRIANGSLLQRAAPVHVAALTQDGGQIRGGSAAFAVDSAARIQAGIWITPGALTVARTLAIGDGATVQLGAHGSLILTGNGEVLTGNGLLDVLSNRPNSVELKGKTSQDLIMAGPSRQFRAQSLDQVRHDSRSRQRLPLTLQAMPLPLRIPSPA